MTDKEINKMLGERIAMYLEERGDTQTDLARYLGVTQTSVSNWVKGVKMPRMDKVIAMCNYFHVPRAALLDENYIHSSEVIPHYENVSAGDAHNNVIGYYAELLNVLLPNANDYFMVTVKGESMMPTIADGDTVLVRKQSDVENGEIAVVLIDGDTTELIVEFQGIVQSLFMNYGKESSLMFALLLNAIEEGVIEAMEGECDDGQSETDDNEASYSVRIDNLS